MQVHSQYENAWYDLRRRELLIRLVALSFLPGVGVLILVTNWGYGDAPEHFGRWVGGGWIAAFLVAAIYRRCFRCPRCDNLYFGRRFSYSPDVCAHCGLVSGHLD